MYSENEKIVFIFVASAALIVVLAILVVLFLVIYQKRIVNQDIRLQKMENERQQLLLKASIEGQEKERRRIAKDLHDGIGSLLSGLSLNMKFQRDQETEEGERKEFLNQVCGLIEDGISNVRAISYDLMPVTLERFGLSKAIEEIIEPLRQNEHHQISFTSSSDNERFRPELELAFLRIFQELMHNTSKHANATKIEINLSDNQENCTLSFRDNGVGLPHEDWKNYSGIGLKGIESRISLINGKLNVESAKNKGVFIQLSAPKQMENE